MAIHTSFVLRVGSMKREIESGFIKIANHNWAAHTATLSPTTISNGNTARFDSLKKTIFLLCFTDRFFYM